MTFLEVLMVLLGLLVGAGLTSDIEAFDTAGEVVEKTHKVLSFLLVFALGASAFAKAHAGLLNCERDNLSSGTSQECSGPVANVPDSPGIGEVLKEGLHELIFLVPALAVGAVLGLGIKMLMDIGEKPKAIE